MKPLLQNPIMQCHQIISVEENPIQQNKNYYVYYTCIMIFTSEIPFLLSRILSSSISFKIETKVIRNLGDPEKQSLRHLLPTQPDLNLKILIQSPHHLLPIQSDLNLKISTEVSTLNHQRLFLDNAIGNSTAFIMSDHLYTQEYINGQIQTSYSSVEITLFL